MSFRLALAFASLTLFVLFAGCSSEGKTPTCPPLPLYDVRDPAERNQARSAVVAARDCVTLPVGLEGGAAGN
ncbi:MAG: hypothetical protein QM756_24275 [Polyangiaceae bacterium]